MATEWPWCTGPLKQTTQALEAQPDAFHANICYKVCVTDVRRKKPSQLWLLVTGVIATATLIALIVTWPSGAPTKNSQLTQAVTSRAAPNSQTPTSYGGSL